MLGTPDRAARRWLGASPARPGPAPPPDDLRSRSTCRAASASRLPRRSPGPRVASGAGRSSPHRSTPASRIHVSACTTPPMSSIPVRCSRSRNPAPRASSWRETIAWCHEEVNVRIVPLLASPVEQNRCAPDPSAAALGIGLPKRGEHVRRDSVQAPGTPTGGSARAANSWRASRRAAATRRSCLCSIADPRGRFATRLSLPWQNRHRHEARDVPAARSSAGPPTAGRRSCPRRHEDAGRGELAPYRSATSISSCRSTCSSPCSVNTAFCSAVPW